MFARVYTCKRVGNHNMYLWLLCSFTPSPALSCPSLNTLRHHFTPLATLPLPSTLPILPHQAAGQGLIELRRIEAAKDIAETMSRSGNVVYLPSGGNMLLGINPR